MKTQPCPLAEGRSIHPGHSWAAGASASTFVPEKDHDRYCNGYQPGPNLVERLHKVVRRPFKFGTSKNSNDIVTEVEVLVRSLRWQLRTRDRKITRLQQSSKLFMLIGDYGYEGYGYPTFYRTVDEAIKGSAYDKRSEWDFKVSKKDRDAGIITTAGGGVYSIVKVEVE